MTFVTGLICKALSLGKMSNFRGDSVRFVPEFISINASNLRGFGGVTGGIRVRSCDHRLRPESCILMESTKCSMCKCEICYALVVTMLLTC